MKNNNTSKAGATVREREREREREGEKERRERERESGHLNSARKSAADNSLTTRQNNLHHTAKTAEITQMRQNSLNHTK